jgi:hypothetical protein
MRPSVRASVAFSSGLLDLSVIKTTLRRATTIAENVRGLGLSNREAAEFAEIPVNLQETTYWHTAESAIATGDRQKIPLDTLRRL